MKLIFNNGSDGEKGYKFCFFTRQRSATPGYYAVHLDDTNIDVSLTVSQRSGMHQYVFPKGAKQVVILDLAHRDRVLDAEIFSRKKSICLWASLFKAWANEQRLFFDIAFSRPFTNVTLLDGKTTGGNVKAAFEFDESTTNILEVEVGISAVDKAGAYKNRIAELKDKSFDQLREEADAIWEKQLNKIVVETYKESDMYNFYSALYHTMIAPNLIPRCRRTLPWYGYGNPRRLGQ